MVLTGVARARGGVGEPGVLADMRFVQHRPVYQGWLIDFIRATKRFLESIGSSSIGSKLIEPTVIEPIARQQLTDCFLLSGVARTRGGVGEPGVLADMRVDQP